MIAARTIDETVRDLAALPRIGSAEAATALARIAGGIPREEAIADLIDQLADLAEDPFSEETLALIEEQREGAVLAAEEAEAAAEAAEEAADAIRANIAALTGKKRGRR